jgi:hypothetical protein
MSRCKRRRSGRQSGMMQRRVSIHHVLLRYAIRDVLHVHVLHVRHRRREVMWDIWIWLHVRIIRDIW